MSKIAALLVACVIAALPVVANAGTSACPDYTGDGNIGIVDILYVVDHYQEPKGDGTVYSVMDILAAIQHYGEACS